MSTQEEITGTAAATPEGRNRFEAKNLKVVSYPSKENYIFSVKDDPQERRLNLTFSEVYKPGTYNLKTGYSTFIIYTCLSPDDNSFEEYEALDDAELILIVTENPRKYSGTFSFLGEPTGADKDKYLRIKDGVFSIDFPEL